MAGRSRALFVTKRHKTSRFGHLVCGGDTDARHLPISASSINRKQSKTFFGIDEDTNANNMQSYLIRTCNIPGATIPDAINYDAIAYIRKCVRQIIINKPHECGLSRHPAPCIQPTRVPFGYGDLVGNTFEHRSSRTAQVYLDAPSLEHAKNDHDAHTTYTTIQLRVYYRTVPDMQHPTPTYGSIALPEYVSSHGTTAHEPIPR